MTELFTHKAVVFGGEDHTCLPWCHDGWHACMFHSDIAELTAEMVIRLYSNAGFQVLEVKPAPECPPHPSHPNHLYAWTVWIR